MSLTLILQFGQKATLELSGGFAWLAVSLLAILMICITGLLLFLFRG